MELIKRKILIESGISRNSGATYNTLTATSWYFKIMLLQDIDDMGMFTDMPFIEAIDNISSPPDYTILINKLSESGITFPFMSGAMPVSYTTNTYLGNLRLSGADVSDFFAYASKITGATDSKLEDVKGYITNNQFIVGFNINTEDYINFKGTSINGVSRVTQNGEPITYTFDGNDDTFIGTSNQTTGIQYKDYTGKTRTVNIDRIGTLTIPLTEMMYNGEGWNETNTSLSALTKEEYLFGITQPPEVQSDIFIDRGTTSVMESHLRLSEVESLAHLERYGNGYYKISRD